MKLKITTLVLSVISFLNVFSQAPNGFNYQAVIRNSSGQPVANKSVSLKFTIHEATPTGTIIYQETQSKSTNAFGLISTIVGTGNIISGAFPKQAQLASGLKYFQVEVDPEGGSNFLDIGTSQIVSVIYSNYSNFSGEAQTSVSANSLSSTATINLNQLSNLGAANGQVLKYDGSKWSPASDNGDDWGSQIVKTDSSFTGNGTTASPLALSQNNASQGNVLKWNGTKWFPGKDLVSVYKGGTGITIDTNNIINSTWTSSGNNISNNNTGLIGLGTSSPNSIAKVHIYGTGIYSSSAAPVYQSALYIDSCSKSSSYSGIYSEGGWRGVFGHNKGNRGGVQAVGVYGLAEGAKYTTGYGVLGNAIGTGPVNYGLFGESSNGQSANFGVYGKSTGSGTSFKSGVYGIGSSTGVYGTTAGNGYLFINSLSTLTPGIVGQVRTVTSGRPVGVVAMTANKTSFGQSALLAYADSNSNNFGIEAYAMHGSSANYGIYATGTGAGTNYAGYFVGLLYASSANSSIKAFKIDHPADPENKYLYHSSIESPDMMNIYNGNVTTDASGDATISLPSYFNLLNKDFKYQLTCIGQFAQAIIIEEIGENNQFKIKTDKPNVKVSWQVSGVRQDAVANMYRIQTEVEKPESEKGFYLIPEAYGFGPERNAAWYRSSLNKTRDIVIKPSGNIIDKIVPLKN